MACCTCCLVAARSVLTVFNMFPGSEGNVARAGKHWGTCLKGKEIALGTYKLFILCNTLFELMPARRKRPVSILTTQALQFRQLLHKTLPRS